MRSGSRFSERRAYSVETRCASTRTSSTCASPRHLRARQGRQCRVARIASGGELDATDCGDSSARSLARTGRTSSLIRVGVGIAVGLGFRDVLFGIVLRLLDWRMRPRRVRYRGIALYVPYWVDRRFDIRASVAAFASARRLDGNFVPRMVRICLHGIVHFRGRELARLLSQAPCQGVASHACHGAGMLATFLQTICRLLQSGLQLVPPRKLRTRPLSSESDAGTRLATDRAQGVGNIGFVQPSHEPSSIHPAHLLHSSMAVRGNHAGRRAVRIRRALIGLINAAVGTLQPPRRRRGSNGRAHPL
jgi:hypothetical protein